MQETEVLLSAAWWLRWLRLAGVGPEGPTYATVHAKRMRGGMANTGQGRWTAES
jgi:hypothetical protein